jgi:hypothetical protein
VARPPKIVEESVADLCGDDYEPLAFAPRELEGRQALEAEVVRWVSNNVDVRRPDPATCPSPFAWTLLRQCRQVPGFMSEFLAVWVKLIPPRSQLESSTTKVQDGKAIIELADRILAHSREAQKKE